MPGRYVFLGGVVDDADASAEATALGRTAEHSRSLSASNGNQSVAALRFEALAGRIGFAARLDTDPSGGQPVLDDSEMTQDQPTAETKDFAARLARARLAKP